MIRLCMLARDEAPAIAGVNDSCGGLVDDVVVLVDDRTVDETERAVRDVFGDRVAAVERFRFVDFSQARNALFARARAGLPEGAWLLLVDPDSPPTGRLPEPLDVPGLDAWSCTWRSGGVEWWLPILVRADSPCRYEGAAHELLVGHSSVWTASLRVEVAAKPSNPARSEMYVDLLSRDSDSNPRSAFYRAKTLADLGRSGEAIEGYLRRAQMGDAGWVEETFYCLLEAGRLLLPLDVELAETLLSRAHLYRPGRIEPLYWLAWLANWAGKHDQAMELCLRASVRPPSSDALFVNRWVEREGIAEEMNKAIVGGATPTDTMELAHG